MNFYVSALGFLYRTLCIISRPNFGTAVVSQGKTSFHAIEKKRFLLDEVPDSGCRWTKFGKFAGPTKREFIKTKLH